MTLPFASFSFVSVVVVFESLLIPGRSCSTDFSVLLTVPPPTRERVLDSTLALSVRLPCLVVFSTLAWFFSCLTSVLLSSARAVEATKTRANAAPAILTIMGTSGAKPVAAPGPGQRATGCSIERVCWAHDCIERPFLRPGSDPPCGLRRIARGPAHALEQTVRRSRRLLRRVARLPASQARRRSSGLHGGGDGGAASRARGVAAPARRVRHERLDRRAEGRP